MDLISIRFLGYRLVFYTNMFSLSVLQKDLPKRKANNRDITSLSSNRKNTFENARRRLMIGNVCANFSKFERYLRVRQEANQFVAKCLSCICKMCNRCEQVWKTRRWSLVSNRDGFQSVFKSRITLSAFSAQAFSLGCHYLSIISKTTFSGLITYSLVLWLRIKLNIMVVRTIICS